MSVETRRVDGRNKTPRAAVSSETALTWEATTTWIRSASHVATRGGQTYGVVAPVSMSVTVASGRFFLSANHRRTSPAR